MAVDTSRDAVESRAARMEAAAIAYKERAPCCGEVCSSGVCAAPACNFGAVMGGLQDAAATLRALLARAEAAETARDFARMCAESAIKTCGDMENERDAALAELDAAREALRRIAGRSDPVADVVIARAALGAASAEGAKDDPHAWKGEGPAPARWTAPDGTIVYRSYEDYCDD